MAVSLALRLLEVMTCMEGVDEEVDTVVDEEEDAERLKEYSGWYKG
jgi:hypothetical protein